MRRFLSLFPNRTDTSLKAVDGLEWRNASRFYTLTDEELADAINRSSKILRAVFAGEQCQFAVLTFVAGGDFYNLTRLAEVKEALVRLGINKTVLYSASGSDDWQLFMFFNDVLNTNEIRSAFSRWLSRAGLAYSKSLLMYPGSEVPLPLPLQSGFAWLNEKAEPVVKREDLTREQAIEMFLNDMADFGNPWGAVSRKFSNPFLRAITTQSDLPAVAPVTEQVESPVMKQPVTPSQIEDAAVSDQAAPASADPFAEVFATPPADLTREILLEVERAATMLEQAMMTPEEAEAAGLTSRPDAPVAPAPPAVAPPTPSSIKKISPNKGRQLSLFPEPPAEEEEPQ